MSDKIPGPALCGFADYFEYGAHPIVGATGRKAAAPHKAAAPPMPPAKKPYPKASSNKTVAQHAAVLTKARQVLAQSHAQVKTAAQKTLAKPAPPVSRRHGAVMGAAVKVAAQSPKVRAAQTKAKAAQVKAQSLTAAAAKTIVAAHQSVTTLAAHVRNQESVARKLSGKGGRAGVHGYVGVDAAGLPPGDPNYDPTTDPSSPQYISPTTTPLQTQRGMGDGSDGLTAAPPALDIDTLVSAMPAGQTPMDQVIADKSTVPWVAYDGSKGTPDGYVLSVYLATRQTDVGAEPDTAQIEGNAHFGYVWGKYDKSDPANGGIGWGSHLQSNAWNHVHGRFWLGDDSWHNVVDSTEAFQSAQKQVNLGAPGAHLSGYQTGGAYGGAYGDASKFKPTYGPLVGNPTMPDFKNMRVDAAGNMGWIASEAPDYIVWPLKAAAALTKAATDKAAKDAAAAAAAAQAKAAADAAAALAAQQAQDALDEEATRSQSAQQSAQAQATADTADAAAAQQDVADQQAAAAQAAAQARQDMLERQQALQEQRYQFQQYKQSGGGQGGVDYQQYQPSGGADQYTDQDSGDQGYDQGGGEESTPEADSDVEAASIDAGEALVGEFNAVLVAQRKQELLDDGVIGGDGEVIGLDDYGNLLE